MYIESNMEIYITECEIDSQWEFPVWLRELKLGLGNGREGWDGGGMFKWRAAWVDLQLIHVDVR